MVYIENGVPLYIASSPFPIMVKLKARFKGCEVSHDVAWPKGKHGLCVYVNGVITGHIWQCENL